MTIEKKFEEIKSIRVFIKNTFKVLTEKHLEIKTQYKTYIDANRKCEYLDSFYFQIKLLDYDYDTTNKLYNYIDNRIYCDYYKLFVIIYSFFKLNFKTEKSEMILKNTKYPIYKDLEPYKIYDFDTVNDIHQDIIRLIEYINKIIQQNEEEIKSHQSKLTSGINIDNYIHNLEYHNNIIVNNVNLYKKYLSAYHTYHLSFLSNLNSKLNCIHEQLDNDINFTQPVKEKKSIIMTKICKRCSKKDAEFCETCMNEDMEQYNRLSDLRNNIAPIIIDREDSLENVIEEPIVEEPIIDKPVVLEPVVDEPVADTPVIEEPINEPVAEPINEPVLEPINEPINEPVLEPINEPINEPVLEPINEQVLEPINEEPVLEPLVVETVIDEQILNPLIEELIIEEPVVEQTVSPSQLFTIYESNINDNALHLVNAIIEPIEEKIINDIMIDNSTNTTDIERKLHHNPPFFLDLSIPNDLSIPKNELTHPMIETSKKKKKHKK
jgi:hypothetical protein